nr:hypothetical protein [Streptomyces sp. MMBL 11-1]
MASANLSAALRAPAHPMAKAGYGKRHAPDQDPPRAHDFAGLEPREAAIAAYIDRLPEGAGSATRFLPRSCRTTGSRRAAARSTG